MTNKHKLCKWKKCRAEFTPKRRWQRFCSGKCRLAEQNAQNTKMIRQYKKLMEAEAQKAVS